MIIEGFPILEKLLAQGTTLSAVTQEWMKKWRGMDLDSADYDFKELSGSTSINLKIRKLDPADPQGFKSRGSFVPLNGAANPDTEIAYFNLAAILGYDSVFRPTTRYELGPKASAVFKTLIEHASIHGSDRIQNRANILKEIASGKPLRGCVKAKKLDTTRAYDEMVDPRAAGNGAPRSSNAVIRSLQAENPQPKGGTNLDLVHGYTGDALQLARELSVLMTLDAIFRQWDRYSGGNAVIAKDDAGVAHFYATDNGGADVSNQQNRLERNIGLFSRYDHRTIDGLKALSAFLNNPASGFLGYTDAETFVVDLGLYRQFAPAEYAARLKSNLAFFLQHVSSAESKHGADAFLAN
ncbi:MAG: hypothetical protein M3Y80_10795 [Verrucomicrobiota bacterium]|nr:hypothetical protein [Verrucomicrobiota bacterium]